MPIIALRCPNCEGNIELDDKNQFGFCIFCGTKIMIQEQIKQRYVLDNSDKIDGWINLSKSAILSRKIDDAKKYADMVIEEDSENKNAWFLKMCCSLMAEKRTREAKFCSEKCIGMSCKDLLDYNTIFIDSLFYRFNPTVMDSESLSFGELDDYQDNVKRIIADIVIKSTDGDKADVFYEFVMKLADYSIELDNGYTKKIVAYISVELFEILEELGNNTYISHSKELKIFHSIMDVIKDAIETQDEIASEDLINTIAEISNYYEKIIELADVAYVGYSEEDNHSAWIFFNEHPDIQKNLEKEFEDGFSVLSEAESKLFGRKKKVEEAKSKILSLFEKEKYPWKYYPV